MTVTSTGRHRYEFDPSPAGAPEAPVPYGPIEPHAADEIGPRMPEEQPVAGFGWRALAGVVDYVILMMAPFFIADAISSNQQVAGRVCSLGGGCYYALVHPNYFFRALVFSWLVLFANTVIMAGLTGRSFGKVLFDLRLVKVVDVTGRIGEVHAYPGIAVCFARVVAHIVDFVPFGVGFVRPAWHWLGRTFADSMLGTMVYRCHDRRLEHVRGRRSW